MTGSRPGAAPPARPTTPDPTIERLLTSLTVISASAQLLQRRARHGPAPSRAEVARLAGLITGAAQQMTMTLAALDAVTAEAG
jgi:hypothetical protein